jgi:hypothetical protein
MGYLYEAWDQISDFCHQQLLRKISATIDDRDLIFGHKRHIGTPYRGKRFWTHQIPTSCLPTLGIWWLQKRFPWYGVPIWSLRPNIRFLPSIVAEKNVTKKSFISVPHIVGSFFWPVRLLFYLCPFVQDIFRRIFLSNCWWQKSDIWSQASYRYTILWVVFLDPSMFNVYKNQLSRQTGSRNLTGPKTLPTIWYTYMTLVTKYQISAINSYSIWTMINIDTKICSS